MADPLDQYAVEALQLLPDKPVQRWVAVPAELDRQVERLYGNGEIPSLAGDGRHLEATTGQVYAVAAKAETPDGARVRWQAVVWLTGEARHPYAIRRWQRASTLSP